MFHLQTLVRAPSIEDIVIIVFCEVTIGGSLVSLKGSLVSLKGPLVLLGEFGVSLAFFTKMTHFWIFL